jgi:molecular chaperone GrpE (heat shock protein)
MTEKIRPAVGHEASQEELSCLELKAKVEILETENKELDALWRRMLKERNEFLRLSEKLQNERDRLRGEIRHLKEDLSLF